MRYYRCQGLDKNGDLAIVAFEIPEAAPQACSIGDGFAMSPEAARELYVARQHIEMKDAESKARFQKERYERIVLAEMKVYT